MQRGYTAVTLLSILLTWNSANASTLGDSDVKTACKAAVYAGEAVSNASGERFRTWDQAAGADLQALSDNLENSGLKVSFADFNRLSEIAKETYRELVTASPASNADDLLASTATKRFSECLRTLPVADS